MCHPLRQNERESTFFENWAFYAVITFNSSLSFSCAFVLHLIALISLKKFISTIVSCALKPLPLPLILSSLSCTFAEAKHCQLHQQCQALLDSKWTIWFSCYCSLINTVYFNGQNFFFVLFQFRIHFFVCELVWKLCLIECVIRFRMCRI